MLTINLLREKKEFVIERLKIKNFEAEDIIEKVLSLDTVRREVQVKTDSLQADMNRISKEIGTLMKDGKKEEAEKEATVTEEKPVEEAKEKKSKKKKDSDNEEKKE